MANRDSRVGANSFRATRATHYNELRHLARETAAGVAAGQHRYGGGGHVLLRERYLVEFNLKVAAPARQKGAAFRKTARADLNWIFTVRTERLVAKDNTVAIGEQCWQLEKSRFRGSLAGCTVTIHQHL